jgi:6-phosphogluconolactonase (cycloisomerase 2 family)
MRPSFLTRRSFLKRAAGLAIAGSGLPSWLRGQDETARGPLIAYVGTYSSPPIDAPPGKVDLPPGNGRGIHLFRVDRATGDLSPAGIFPSSISPSSLTFNAAGTRLYSTNATDKRDGGRSGSLSSFAVSQTDGQLTLLNTVSSGGIEPTYVSLHPSGKYAFVANYGGTVAAFPIGSDGRLGSASDVKASAGTVGPKRATDAPPGSFAISGHDLPHAHMIQADPAGRFVLSVNLGYDQILVWKFEPHAGTLSPNDPAAFDFPPGDGPRHFAFHPNGGWLYSLQEEASTIVLFDYDAARGRLAPRQTVSSLPPGFAGSNFTSEIMVSSDGRFVYAANRLHDSIAVFAVGTTGTLEFTGEEWTRGDYPRSFNFDPTGNFLYSCNQRSDAIAGFRVDRQTGALACNGQYTSVGNPSVIVFLDLGRPAV